MIHRLSRWYFIFGHSPHTTGYPHVGIKRLPARIHYSLPVNGLSLAPSLFVSPSFSFHCFPIISLCSSNCFSYTLLSPFSIFRYYHLGFITNSCYNTFNSYCFSYCAPDVLCNWQVMFFHFTHQEFYYLLTGKPLLNPATMAGFSEYNSGAAKTHPLIILPRFTFYPFQTIRYFLFINDNAIIL